MSAEAQNNDSWKLTPQKPHESGLPVHSDIVLALVMEVRRWVAKGGAWLESWKLVS